jgi:hypothetical protein
MATWAEFASEQPELAARVLEFLNAHKHKTIATLRKDRSPRISGTECRRWHQGRGVVHAER